MYISGDIHDKEISPVLLLTFVENAFKHGVNKNTGNVVIDINFKVKGDYLYFIISNPMPELTVHKDNFNKSSGIGIENVKKRLELGYNKSDYKLSFKNKKNIFVVKLVIKVT